MSEKVQKKLKQTARQNKVIELRAEGLTLQEIADELKCNEKTVRRDLESQNVQDFVDELIRQQLADIIGSQIKTRLQYRDKLLDKLMPKKIQQKGEVEATINVSGWGLDIPKENTN